MDLRSLSISKRHNLGKFRLESFRQAYDEVSGELNKQYRPEVHRTFFEDLFFKLLRSNTRLQVLRSFWIGKRNIDLFIPAFINDSVRPELKLKGLAIEIDGPIHNEEFKMKRDESKFKILDELSICSVVIQNQSFDHPDVAKILRDISTFRNFDYRSKQRMFRNIYLKTIISNKDLCLERNLVLSKSILRSLGEI